MVHARASSLVHGPTLLEGLMPPPPATPGHTGRPSNTPGAPQPTSPREQRPSRRKLGQSAPRGPGVIAPSEACDVLRMSRGSLGAARARFRYAETRASPGTGARDRAQARDFRRANARAEQATLSPRGPFSVILGPCLEAPSTTSSAASSARRASRCASRPSRNHPRAVAGSVWSRESASSCWTLAPAPRSGREL